MQFSYQFPERCERLVLVDSGGLGRDVNWLLRAATLPGSELVLPFLAATRLLDAGARAGGLLNRLGLGLRTDLEEIARGHSTLSDSATRAAFVHTLRSVVEAGGQRVDASNRLYLAEHLPFLLIWGERDSIIPVSHGHATHKRMPNSRLEVFPHSGHFPQLDEPERFLDVLIQFIDSTEPASSEDSLERERDDSDADLLLIRLCSWRISLVERLFEIGHGRVVGLTQSSSQFPGPIVAQVQTTGSHWSAHPCFDPDENNEY